MQERVHLVNGRFSVDSKPGKGTRILAAVPLVAQVENSPVDEPGEKAGSARRKLT